MAEYVFECTSSNIIGELTALHKNNDIIVSPLYKIEPLQVVLSTNLSEYELIKVVAAYNEFCSFSGLAFKAVFSNLTDLESYVRGLGIDIPEDAPDEFRGTQFAAYLAAATFAYEIDTAVLKELLGIARSS